MKFIKRLFFLLLGVIAVLLIAAVFISKDMNCEKEVIINKPKQQVFDYVKYLKNQDAYSKWATLDANMKKEYRGTDATPGFVSVWDSENGEAGKGEQEIKKIDEGNRIDYELRFIKPIKSIAQAYMITEAMDSTHTKVKWGFASKMAYPFNAMKIFMNMEKAIGEDFSFGLNKLKTVLEK